MTGIYGINYSNNYSLTGNYGYAYSTGAVSSAQPEEKGMVVNPGKSDVEKPGRKSSPAECETCKNRKYQDGSNEMVSFKSASHISPQASASRVRAHEQEHVTNAYNKAAQNNGKVLSATVSLRTAVCPECGTVYTAGGTTTTKISYSDESNPYQQNKKSAADSTRIAIDSVNVTVDSTKSGSGTVYVTSYSIQLKDTLNRDK